MIHKNTFLLLLIMLATAFLFTGCTQKSYDIKITIPHGSMDAYIYSDTQICPKHNKVTLYTGEGMGDGEVVLEPVDTGDTNIYTPQYITPGMGVEFDVDAGAWYKIGVNNMQMDSGEDVTVYLKVSGVEVRIA